MTIQVNYNLLNNICHSMADKIVEYSPNELVFVYTSGMQATSIISNKTNLSIGFYRANPPELNVDQNSHKVVFIDNQIDLMKIENIRCFMKNYCPDIQWMIASVIIDDTIDCSSVPELLIYGIKTPFPVEIQ